MAWGFHRSSKAWYHNDGSSELDTMETFNIGDYSDGGGCTFEFRADFVDLGGAPTLRLTVYDDAFLGLFGSPEGILFLSMLLPHDTSKFKHLRVSPDDFERLLLTAGLKDFTARVNPHDGKPVKCDMCGQELKGAT